MFDFVFEMPEIVNCFCKGEKKKQQPVVCSITCCKRLQTLPLEARKRVV